MTNDASGALVVDASVVAKLYFNEQGSERARSVLKSGAVLLAPDLVFVEVASIALKRVRRGFSTAPEAAFAVSSVRDLIDEVTPTGDLTDDAFRLAAQAGLSAYDACYVALAEVSGAPVITADERLVRMLIEAGLSHRVVPLQAT